MIYALTFGALLDLLLGDPRWLPHPVRGIGLLIQTLERVLREGQFDAVATVAYAIRNKINASGEQLHGDDYSFLLAYYDAVRGRMERGLLFGKRRLDKYDR